MSQAAPVNEDKFLGDLKRWGGIASVALGARSEREGCERATTN
jgi:hypothetical protein